MLGRVMASIGSPGGDRTGGSLGARLGSYRVIYVAVAIFALLYVYTVKGTERALGAVFETRVEQALDVRDFRESVSVQIQRRISEDIRRSVWVRWGGVDASVLVIGKDGRTLIYAGGPAPPPPDAFDLMANLREAERLLPADAQVTVSLPHNTLLANAILLVYAAALIQGLFLYNRSVSQRERAELDQALEARDAAAERTGTIERELDDIRQRLLEVEPAEQGQAREVAALRQERQQLQAQLTALTAREEELRSKAARALELDQERHSLEELLEEAASDLSSRDDAIRDLEQRLSKAAKSAKAKAGARARETEMIERRFRTLYKNLEVDDRALEGIVALGDESLRLKCEDNLKRLDGEADNVAVRRKVGGLPNHLSIFELSFAGKGRVYYQKGQHRRFRVLLVGGKASQRADLEYLSRLES